MAGPDATVMPKKVFVAWNVTIRVTKSDDCLQATMDCVFRSNALFVSESADVVRSELALCVTSLWHVQNNELNVPEKYSVLTFYPAAPMFLDSYRA